MEIIFVLSVILLLLPFPFMAGYIAVQFGRSFWLWFCISLPLPLISCFILMCFPDKSLREIPVESQDIFKELNGIR